MIDGIWGTCGDCRLALRLMRCHLCHKGLCRRCVVRHVEEHFRLAQTTRVALEAHRRNLA